MATWSLLAPPVGKRLYLFGPPLKKCGTRYLCGVTNNLLMSILLPIAAQ
jgi:hypothetical protein